MIIMYALLTIKFILIYITKKLLQVDCSNGIDKLLLKKNNRNAINKISI
jgi:hypothetical protein